MSTFAFAFLAGILSILSPCVLPLLPIVLGASLSQHKFGSVALACGLAISFMCIGLFIAVVGFSIGLDAQLFQKAAAFIMVVVGIVLVTPSLQVRFAAASGPAANAIEQRFNGFSTNGLKGQFAVGLLMGAVWSPCVGPTLGAASVLAAKGKNIGTVALTMLFFGIGAGLPLVLLGLTSRQTMLRLRSGLMLAGKGTKIIFGLFMMSIGVLILTGLDKNLESFLVAISPDWLTKITTYF